MKAHYVVFDYPVNWALRPPVMKALCGTRIDNAYPVEAPFEVSQFITGKTLPEFNSLRDCRKCYDELIAKAACPSDEWGNTYPREGKLYVYAILPAQEAFEEEHRGLTIIRCEEAVKKAEGK